MQQGSVIIALVPDPAGGNLKERPLVIVSPTASVKAGEPIVAVAISTQISDPLEPTEIELPYHPQGTARTGLTKPSVAKCHWLCTLQQSDVRATKGYVSGSVLQSILASVNAQPE
jgi:mRNA-degrading endonuclease toxin of MazEF toxin-antitoxin module